MKHALLLLFIIAGLFSGAQNPVLQEIANEVDMTFVRENIYELCGYDSVTIDGQKDIILSRHKNRPGNELSFLHLANEAYNLGYDTAHMPFSSTGKNLLITKPGTVNPNKKVMICAHYDGLPTGPRGPAADDNASACITVLEAMRIFSDKEFENTVVFAFWDEEEQGLIGSTAYAAQSVATKEDLICVYNMDAMAHDSDSDHVARIHITPDIPASADFADSIIKMNNDLSLGLDLLTISPGATYSDHAAFWAEDIAAVYLIEDWDNDQNPGYHTINDDTSYFNWPYYEKMLTISITTVASWAKPIIPDSTVSIKDILQPKIVSYSPNPVRDVLHITSEREVTTISFYNTLGEVIAHRTIFGHTTKFNFHNLPSGLYYFIAESEGVRQRGEFIKQ